MKSIFEWYNNIEIIKMGERFVIGGTEARYKLILIGDVNVGKTALFWRYTEGEFLASKNTLVTTIDFKMKEIVINNSPIKLYIWDTAGSQKYRSIVSTYFKGCHGIIIIFDLSRQSSFTNAVQNWYELAKAKSNNPIFLMVGNKSDLDIRVDTENVKKWCAQHKMEYIETSVKDNKNVHEVFDSISRNIHSKQISLERTQSFNLNQGKSTNKENKKCCS